MVTCIYDEMTTPNLSAVNGSEEKGGRVFTAKLLVIVINCKNKTMIRSLSHIKCCSGSVVVVLSNSESLLAELKPEVESTKSEQPPAPAEYL